MPSVHKNSEGRAVQFTAEHTIGARMPALFDKFIGVTTNSGNSGETVVLDIEQVEYQIDVGDSLDPSVGDVIYVTVASVTEHEIPNTALTTTADGANTRAFLKVTSAKDANNIVTGILMPQEA